RPDTGGVTEADPIMNPFLRVGGGRCSPGGGAGAPPARCSGAFGEGEAEGGGPLAFEHVDRPVQPFDAFAVDGDRAALDLVGVGEGAVQFGLEVERWHGGEVRAHHEHEPHQPVRVFGQVGRVRVVQGEHLGHDRREVVLYASGALEVDTAVAFHDVPDPVGPLEGVVLDELDV